MSKTAFFIFEASPTIGAGHAIRSCVLLDALIDSGWGCKIVTSAESYTFLTHLDKYERIDPTDFYNQPEDCDLLVIDNYDVDEKIEKTFRPFAHKIMVIDDLANRKHDCDILLDQTYGRLPAEYQDLVPDTCEILTGSDYVLLRKEFVELRPKALIKRGNTTEIKRILVSMGGSDPQNCTMKALEMVKNSEFKGAIDIVLGFSSVHQAEIQQYCDDLPNECIIHINPNMPELTLNADLAIGAAGSSVWERCCLGLPSVLIVTAENQVTIYQRLTENIKGIYSGLDDAFRAKYPDDIYALFALVNPNNFKGVINRVGN